MALDPFYPIFDHVSWIERLVPLGIRLVQLRIKDEPQTTLRAQIRAAREICSTHHCQLIVNDYWKLALDEGCDFIHLGQEDLDEADLDAIHAGGLKLGVSSHDEAELDRALRVDPAYIALGPVYPTILKKMKWHQQGLPRVGEWKSKIGAIPLVGIGGMSVERAPGVFEAGADIVSVVTDITLNRNPAERVREWLTATREFAR
ncbi:thiamine-phosphate diphosphorylase [Pseudaminobacter salicylatoxidans]|uniref:Thiamine-phosphate diphosphorylase n=2 Tax=Pseudaminobacter salicylatoxidans TaxID=93369 RepID=A0A316C4P8_PSESE|nr:thiamine-phosphate diphosphorylase [Pseudaminobacter salicylatoxidans]